MDIQTALNTGRPQHAALIFNGGVWDVIGSERIVLDDGFTLTQTFCTDENLKPGAIAYNDFTSQMINDDGALNGFDFERKATLLLGVETEQERLSGLYTDQVLCQLYLGTTRIWIFKIGVSYAVYKMTGSETPSLLKSGSSLCIFASNQSNSETDFYLFIARKYDNEYQIAKYSVMEDGTTTMVYDFTTFSNFSPYAFTRFEKLRDEGICDVFHSTGAIFWERYQLKNGLPYRTRIDFKSKALILGKKPRSTSAKVVLFSGATDISRLEQNADAYASDVWTSSKMMAVIFNEIANNDSTFSSGFLPANVESVSFSTNPFSKITGLTYRELLAYVCEACGVIAREYVYTPQLINDVTFSCSSIWIAPDLSHGNTSHMTLTADEYFEYDAADFEVAPYNKSVWKQVIPLSGAYTSEMVVGSGDTKYIVANNPVADAYVQSHNGSGTLLNAFNQNTREYYSGKYKPCTLNSHLGMLVDAGDNITIYLEDGSTTRFPVFVNTITWMGGAECTIESTGVERFSQYDDPSFRSMLQNANQAYRIADNTQPNSSSINVKHDVNRLTGTGDIVDNLRPVTFRYNFDQEDRLHYGLIYEEIVGKYPALVRENPDDTKKRVNYQEIIPILLAEIQDLRKRVKDLETGKN